MIKLCIGIAGVIWAQLPVDNFTLSWTHSIEKINWQEDYQVKPDGLLLVQARVKGTGAGMEIPQGAKFANGSWHYQPKLPLIQPLKLARTPEAGDYEICDKTSCKPLSYWIGKPTKQQPMVELWSCDSGIRKLWVELEYPINTMDEQNKGLR